VAGTSPPSVSAATAQRKERFVQDEETQNRPRRRGVLLAMLVAAALLLALAGSGAVAGNGGRHCHHDQNQGPQQDPTGAPPV